jgi:phosphopantetheine adenylyltransferase
MKQWNDQSPTVQLLGRYQPWHPGHTELFKRAHAKTGQVCIMVRDTCGTDEKNPFDFVTVKNNIIRDLTAAGFENDADFKIVKVPNIVNITYGRDVGYTIEKEDFDKEILKISATQIRKEMGL